MDKHFTYTPEGVCARELCFDIVDGIIHNVKFTGGCAGNTTGVAMLAEGMPARDVIKRLRGVDCHGGFSCPDQLSKAIEKCLDEMEEQA